MRDFDFLQPTSVGEASRMLADLGEDARAIAGGTALMLAMRQRLLAPTHLVSLAGIPELRGIAREGDGGLSIGALTLHAELAASLLVRDGWAVLADMAARVANPQVRNQGTLGGNLCYADPATDPPGCLMALGAEVSVASARGMRRLPVDAFVVDYFTTALEPDELVVALHLPPMADDARARYARHLRTAAEHRPLASLATLVRLRGGVCTEARIVVGASTAVPTRVVAVEAMLRGRTPSAGLLVEVAQRIADEIDPISDARGSGDYRREVVRVVARRELAALFGLEPVNED